MPRIFINYRRDDSAGYAGRLHETLASVYGTASVFIDIDDIRPGVDFVTTIENSIADCDVMLVLIGKRWLDSRDALGLRRIDDPADFVRVEIARGLARNIRLLPILIDDAAMPAHADLPADIAPLATIEAIELADSRWQYDIGQLVTAIGGQPLAPRRRLRPLALAAVAAAILLAAAGWRWMPRPAADLSGRWVADVRYDFGVRHAETFDLRFAGTALTGSATFLGVPRGIVDGHSDGKTISFVTRSDEMAGSESRQAQHRYVGTVDGANLRLSMQTEGGFSSHPPVDFVATR